MRWCGLIGVGCIGVLLLGTPVQAQVRTEARVLRDHRIPLAIQQSSTLVDDMAIRITNAGFDFLARQIQWLMSGWVRRDRVQLDAPNTVSTMLADLLMGLKSYFDVAGIDACLYLGNSDDDDKDGSSCDCGIRYGLDPPGDWNALDCSQCWPGGSSNPDPTGPWGTDPNVSGCANGSTTGLKLAKFPDPANPDDPTVYYWCKGPFYDSSLNYNNYRIDPDCLKRDPADSGEPCPDVGTGQGCDLVCDTANDAANDVRVVLTNNTVAEQLDIYIELEYVKVDGFLWYAFPCDCCFLEKRDGTSGSYGTYEGSLINPNYVDINGLLRFVDGYGTMLGRDGEPYGGSGSTGSGSTSGGSSGTPDKGSCSPPSSSGGGSTGGGGGTPPAPLDNDPLVGVVLEVPDGSVNLQNSLEIDEGYSGPCYDQGWACDAGCAIVGDLIDAFDSFLTGFIEDTVRNLLADNIQPLVEEELGLPLDFPMLIAGQGSGLAKDVCALRMPNAADHILGFTCSHTTGDCPCDDYDGDGWLNYQDPSAGITPTGCPAGTWCGAWNDTGEMYYSWYYGLGNSIGGYNGSEPPFFETGAYADDRWDTAGVTLLLDPTIVPYKTPNAASLQNGVPQHGYYPDPNAANGVGPWWSDGAGGFPGRSCFPVVSLILDSTEGDDDLTTRTDAPGVNDPNNAGSPLSQAEFDALLDDWDDAASNGIHFGFMFSQQFLQEFLYDLYASGMLCIDVTKEQFPFLADQLRVANFKMFVPMLGDTDASGSNYIWDQDGYVELRFIPSGVPYVRVLGSRSGCFPDGDVIAPDTIYFAHEGLDEHVPASSCSPAPSPDANLKNVYDLLIYFPDLYIDVSAPLAASGLRQRLFRMRWDLALAVAVEYSFGLPNGGSGTTWPGNLPRFFEILVDGALGCGGDLFGASVTSEGNWSGFAAGLACGIEEADVPITEVEHGISGFLHGIINAAFSTVLQTKIFLGGLNIDFYKISYAKPDALDPLRLDSDPVGDYGYGTPDYLVLAGRFQGTLDFAGLFGLLGGISLAPRAPGEPLGVETYVGLLGTDGASPPLRQVRGRLELSPAESRAAGFGPHGGRLALAAEVVGFADEAAARETVTYSWRLDGGLWHPYRPGDTLRLPPLASGRHTVEVRARVGGLLVDDDPARLTFWVDGVPPDLFVRAADGRSLPFESEAPVYVAGLQVWARDNVSDPEFLELAYSVDGGPWQPAVGGYVPVETWSRAAPHTVHLRATDEFGNVRERRLTVMVGDLAPTGCGCAVVGGGAGSDLILLLLLMVWSAFRQRLQARRAPFRSSPRRS